MLDDFRSKTGAAFGAVSDAVSKTASVAGDVISATVDGGAEAADVAGIYKDTALAAAKHHAQKMQRELAAKRAGDDAEAEEKLQTYLSKQKARIAKSKAARLTAETKATLDADRAKLKHMALKVQAMVAAARVAHANGTLTDEDKLAVMEARARLTEANDLFKKATAAAEPVAEPVEAPEYVAPEGARPTEVDLGL